MYLWRVSAKISVYFVQRGQYQESSQLEGESVIF
jgi:hypothetical protein